MAPVVPKTWFFTIEYPEEVGILRGPAPSPSLRTVGEKEGAAVKFFGVEGEREGATVKFSGREGATVRFFGAEGETEGSTEVALVSTGAVVGETEGTAVAFGTIVAIGSMNCQW